MRRMPNNPENTTLNGPKGSRGPVMHPPLMVLKTLLMSIVITGCASVPTIRYFQPSIDPDARAEARALLLEVVQNYQSLESYRDEVVRFDPLYAVVLESGEEIESSQVRETSRTHYVIGNGLRFLVSTEFHHIVSDGQTIWFEDSLLLRHSRRDLSGYLTRLLDEEDDEDIELEAFPVLTFHPVTLSQLIEGEDFRRVLPGLYDFISVEDDPVDGEILRRIDLIFDWDEDPSNGYALSRVWVDPGSLLIKRFGLYYGPFTAAEDLVDPKGNQWVEFEFTSIEVNPPLSPEQFSFEPQPESTEVFSVYDRYELEAEVYSMLGDVFPDPGFVSPDGEELSLRSLDGRPTLLMFESLGSFSLQDTNEFLQQLRREVPARDLNILRLVFDVGGSDNPENLSTEEYLRRYPGRGMVTFFSNQSELAEAILGRREQLAALLDEHGVFQDMPFWSSDYVQDQLARLSAGEDLFDPAGVARARAVLAARSQAEDRVVPAIQPGDAAISGYSGQLVSDSWNHNPSTGIRFDLDSDGIPDYVSVDRRQNQGLVIRAYALSGDQILSLSVPELTGDGWFRIIAVLDADGDGSFDFLVQEETYSRFDDAREINLFLVSPGEGVLWAAHAPPMSLEAPGLVPQSDVKVVVDDWNEDGGTDIIVIQSTVLMRPTGNGGYSSDSRSPSEQRIIVLDARGSVQWQASADFEPHAEAELTPALPQFNNRRALSLSSFGQLKFFFWPE